MIQIAGNGTIQSTLDITTGAAGFGTAGVETGSVSLDQLRCWSSPAARSARSTAFVGLNGANARIADAGTLATNSALTGLNTVSGDFRLAAGASVTTTGGLSITGSGDGDIVDSPFNNGGGGSSLTVGGTLTDSSTNSNALYIGNTNISAGDTVTAKALVNTGDDPDRRATAPSSRRWTSPAGRPGSARGSGDRIGYLSTNALLEFASGQIGTIAGGRCTRTAPTRGSPTPARWQPTAR